LAKILCPCGETIRTSGPIPNPIEWLLVSDKAFDTLGPIDRQELHRQMVSLFRCPVSDHLFVFWGGLDSPGTTYQPAGKIE
jgi:hypothetical protein